jgi:WD40 repeat protein
MSEINESIIGIGTQCGHIRILDINSMNLLLSFVSSLNTPISGLKMLSNDVLVTSGSTNGYVKVFNLNSMNSASLVKSLNENSNIFSLDVINNDTIAIGVGTGSISVWKISTGIRIKSLSTGVIASSLIYLKTYGLLFSSGTNYYKIWNITTWTVSTNYNFAYSSSNFTKINDYSIFFTNSNTLYLFNLRTNKTNRITTSGSYYSIAALKNDLVVVSNLANTLVFFNSTNNAQIKSITSAHSGNINSIINIPSKF